MQINNNKNYSNNKKKESFEKSVLSNVTGNAIYDAGLWILKKLIKR